jgi:hypothetical protein
MILNKQKIFNAINRPRTKPFTHYVVDNILNYDFTNEEEFIFNYSLYHQLLGELSVIKNDILKIYNPIRIQQPFEDADVSNTWSRVHWLTNGPHVEQEVHMDHYTKLWTLIIYCYGSTGTYLLDKNKEFSKEVEWKQNRGLIFCPGNKHVPTYHRVVNKESNIRRVITLNITSEDYPIKGLAQAFDKFNKIIINNDNT